MRQLRDAGVLGALALGLILVFAAPAAAAPFTVTRFDDPVPDACAAGDCSLREAIRAANASPGADTIALGAGTYLLQRPGTSDATALNGDLDITDDLSLTGAGAGATTIDAQGTAVTGERVFEADPAPGGSAPQIQISAMTMINGKDSFGGTIRVANEAAVTIADATMGGNDGVSFGGVAYVAGGSLVIRDSELRGNDGVSFGGGVDITSGAVTIERSSITGNTNTSFGGGLLVQGGQATVRDSTIADNPGIGNGGGIMVQAGSLLVEDSTLSGNSMNQDGGGLAVQAGETTLRNVTIAGNSAGDRGGGIYVQGASTIVRLESSTVSGNTADSDLADGDLGGGIFRMAGTLTLANTILAGNVNAGAPDCAGGLTSNGFNLIGNPAGCAFVAAGGDLVGSAGAPINAQLGLLAANGGLTQTLLPAPSSPAVDAGTANGLTLDQRGLPRPVNQPLTPAAPGGDGSDIGSVELQDTELTGAIVKVKKKQKQKGKKIVIKLQAGAAEDVVVVAKGKLKSGKKGFPLKSVTTSSPPGGLAKITLKPKKKSASKKIFRALDAGKKVKGNLSVKLSDASGNAITQGAKVKLR